MKIKAVAGLIGSGNCIYSYIHRGVQWIGDGMCLYPMYSLPTLDEAGVKALLDITDKKKDKTFLHTIKEIGVNLDDYDPKERELERSGYIITYAGRELTPYQSDKGILYFDADYLKPVKDMEQLSLFVRYGTGGRPYIAIKAGMLLVGICLPENGINRKFIDTLTAMAAGSRKTLDWMERRKREQAEEEYEQSEFAFGEVESNQE